MEGIKTWEEYTVEYFAGLDDKSFERYWNNRGEYRDLNTIDAIYREYYKRKLKKQGLNDNVLSSS